MAASTRLRSSIEIVNNGGSGKRAAVAPYQMTDTRLSYGWANTLIEAATPKDDRESLPLVDYDFHRVITSMGRRTLFSMARTMVWRIPPLWAAIQEQANLATSPFTPRYMGANKAWGEQASEWLANWHQVMCMEGWPYDYETFCELLVTAPIVDGEIHVMLTEDGSGNARTQFIPAHRVGARWVTGGSCRVRYEGNQLFIDDNLVDDSLPYSFSETIEWTAPVIDGVIVDGQSKPIAYRIYDDPAVSGTFRDISARSCFPAFFPQIAGQLHGISLLATSIFDWQDWREFKRWENLAQKAFSTRTIVETNESGEADEAKMLIQSAGTFNTDGGKATLPTQKLDAGTITYLKARSGSTLQAFNWNDRPGRNTQDWQEMTARDAMAGTEWSIFFSLDPKHVGGAPMRVVVDRLNRVLRKRRRVVSKAVRRVDVYALAKAIKRGDLPMDPDWFRWTYQGPPDMTADRRYDAQTDQMEYQLGWSTLQDIEDRRNGSWLLKREQKEAEVRDLYSRARKINEEFGIPIQEAAARLEMAGNAFINLGENVTDSDTKDSLSPSNKQGEPVKPNQK